MRDEIERFIEQCKLRYAASTVETIVAIFKRYGEWLSETKIDYLHVNRCQIERFLLAQRWSQGRRRRALYLLRQYYAFIELPDPAKGLHIPPDKAVKLPKLPPKRSVKQLIDKIDGHTDEITLRNRLIIELAYGSGLRRTELVLLNVEDIDLAGRSVRIKGKGDKVRMAPLTAKAASLIEQYLSKRRYNQAHGPLLQNYWYGTRIKPRSVGLLVKRITGHNTHSFRHACATHMLQNGCNLRYIQALLGHTRLTTTQLYTQIDKRHLKRTLHRYHPRAAENDGPENDK